MNHYLSKGLLFCLIGILITGLVSCNKEGCGETVISKTNQTGSHKTGQNCMNCHQDGEEGEGCFTVAGSVYDSLQMNPQPNGKLVLVIDPAASTTPVAIVEVDAYGNLFTTEGINWGDGLYAIVEGASGDVQVMNDPVISGDCNSCHGSSTGKIWVK